MKFAFFDETGRVREAHNDDTKEGLPDGAVELTDEQWEARWDLVLTGGTVSVSAQTPALSALREAAAARLSRETRAAIRAGYDCDALGAMHHYPANETDQLNVAGLVVAAMLDGTGCNTSCADGSGVWARRSPTAEQIQAVGRAARDHVAAAQAAYEIALQTLNAAETAEAVSAVSL